MIETLSHFLPVDTSALLLESAIKDAATSPMPLLHAIYWLECALSVDKRIPSNVYKNAGLGHIHLIQNKYFSKFPDELPKVQPELLSMICNVTWPKDE